MLSPPADVFRLQLALVQRSYLSVTAAALAIRHTAITPPVPAPEWLSPMQGTLATAQAAAENWLGEIGPRNVADLPQGLIDFAEKLGAHAATVGGTDASAAQNALQQLAAHAAAHRAAAASIYLATKAYADGVRTLRPLVEETARKALADAVVDEARIMGLRNSIAALVAKLSGQGVSIEDSLDGLVSSGAGLSVTVMTYAFATATAGAAAVPFLGMAAGLVAIGAGAAKIAITRAEVQEELREIGRLQVKLSVVEQQVAALHGIVAAMGALDLAVTAVGAGMDLAPFWDDIGDRLADISGQLALGLTDSRDLPAIQAIEASAGTWADAAAWAGRVQAAGAGQPPQLAVPISPPS